MATVKVVTELDLGKALDILNDKVDVQVSAQEGNIIELKDDGLFAVSTGAESQAMTFDAIQKIGLENIASLAFAKSGDKNFCVGYTEGEVKAEASIKSQKENGMVKTIVVEHTFTNTYQQDVTLDYQFITDKQTDTHKYTIKEISSTLFTIENGSAAITVPANSTFTVTVTYTLDNTGENDAKPFSLNGIKSASWNTPYGTKLLTPKNVIGYGTTVLMSAPIASAW
ncbi:hypothetical protein [Lonepinella sp. BR2474]|uniref:hypothetical protein n=1 Tax=Lonepinella sp. BR2474 TaxID=3434548 RepID=UPI003F6DEB24